MIVHRFDFNTETALAKPEVAAMVNELIEILKAAPVPFWPDKSPTQSNLSILQSLLNACLAQELKARGWAREVKINKLQQKRGGARVDFCRFVDGRHVALEVQLGNTSRGECDKMKFIELLTSDRMCLNIQLMFVRKTATLTDSGITSYETDLEVFEERRNNVYRHNPIAYLCLGLEHDPENMLDLSKSLIPSAHFVAGTDRHDGKGKGKGKALPKPKTKPKPKPKTKTKTKTPATKSEILGKIATQIRLGVPVEEISL